MANEITQPERSERARSLWKESDRLREKARRTRDEADALDRAAERLHQCQIAERESLFQRPAGDDRFRHSHRPGEPAPKIGSWEEIGPPECPIQWVSVAAVRAALRAELAVPRMNEERVGIPQACR